MSAKEVKTYARICLKIAIFYMHFLYIVVLISEFRPAHLSILGNRVVKSCSISL